LHCKKEKKKEEEEIFSMINKRLHENTINKNNILLENKNEINKEVTSQINLLVEKLSRNFVL
jgi:hypothetical protein